jgi:hypothetical protein
MVSRVMRQAAKQKDLGTPNTSWPWYLRSIPEQPNRCLGVTHRLGDGSFQENRRP